MINMIHSGLSGPAGKKTRKKRSDPWAASAGKGVRLRQAEAERTSVDVYLNLFGNLAHGTSVMVYYLMPHCTNPDGRRKRNERV